MIGMTDDEYFMSRIGIPRKSMLFTPVSAIWDAAFRIVGCIRPAARATARYGFVLKRCAALTARKNGKK
ncbi:hypothetical protein D3C75_1214530 [compost metagenome]